MPAFAGFDNNVDKKKELIIENFGLPPLDREITSSNCYF